jgi:hypothetical protein
LYFEKIAPPLIFNTSVKDLIAHKARSRLIANRCTCSMKAVPLLGVQARRLPPKLLLPRRALLPLAPVLLPPYMEAPWRRRLLLG